MNPSSINAVRCSRAARVGMVLALAAPALAGSLPEQFTLGKFVPSDVWFYVHVVHNPERDWIDQQWTKVFEAARQAGLDREVGQFLLSTMDVQKREELQPKLERMLNALRSVNWSELCGNEFVIGYRLSSSKLTYDYIVLARARGDSAEENFGAISACLKEVSTVGGGLRVVQRTEEGIERVSLKFDNTDVSKMGVAIELFRRGDIIGFCTGEGATTDVIDRLAGKSKSGALFDDPRFQKALSQVQTPRDSLMYFDGKRCFSDMRDMVRTVAELKKKHEMKGSKKDGGSEECEETGRAAADAKIRLLVDEVLPLADVIDYTMETRVTKGARESADSVLIIQPGKQDSPLAAAFLDRRAFDRFDEFIPSQATGFSLSSSVDVQKVYKVGLTILDKLAPEASAAVANVQLELANQGFELERDFFSWWSGETISIDLPAAMVSPMGGSDSVVLIRVKDSRLAEQKVNAALDFAVAKAKAHGQALSVGPAAVAGEGFREITHPALAFIIRPVVGVREDWLMIGSSAAAINKCLAVKSGEAPSIRKKEQFAEEGVAPEGPVMAAKFEDLSRMGSEMAAVVGMIGTFGQMAVAQFPEKDEAARKFKQFAQGALRIAAKLGPILQKIDFYSSSSSVTTYDGKSTLRITSVTTYKPGPAVANSSSAK